jgi:hypothetical protein
MFSVTIGCASGCSLPHYFCIFDSGVKIRKQCLLSFFMINYYYCLDGTRSEYSGHATPSLEEYLPLDEQLLPPPTPFIWVILGIFGEYRVHIIYRSSSTDFII